MSKHTDWQTAHQHLTRIAKDSARLDEEEGGSLRALRANVHLHLGYATFAEYIERLFGYNPRWTEERLRVAEALETLPNLQQALRDGAVPWSTARELTRVAIRENEHDWLQASRGRTLRQVEQLVTGHKPGDHPNDPADCLLNDTSCASKSPPKHSPPSAKPWPSSAVNPANHSTKTPRYS